MFSSWTALCKLSINFCWKIVKLSPHTDEVWEWRWVRAACWGQLGRGKGVRKWMGRIIPAASCLYACWQHHLQFTDALQWPLKYISDENVFVNIRHFLILQQSNSVSSKTTLGTVWGFPCYPYICSTGKRERRELQSPMPCGVAEAVRTERERQSDLGKRVKKVLTQRELCRTWNGTGPTWEEKADFEMGSSSSPVSKREVCPTIFASRWATSVHTVCVWELQLLICTETQPPSLLFSLLCSRATPFPEESVPSVTYLGGTCITWC